MDLFQVDVDGHLFISPDIDEWDPVFDRGITVVFDLDGDLDIGVPSVPNRVLYVYYPFQDAGLPDVARLHEMARLGASLIRQGARVLSHCGMGFNRSALLAGIILTYLGASGEEALDMIRNRREGALYNETFASYLCALPPYPEG
jgi:protein-tyrosine phosphatase